MTKHLSKQFSLSSTESINQDLKFIRNRTKAQSGKEILNQILRPLAQIIADKESPCGFIVYPDGDRLVIQSYGYGNFVFSGKNTPMNEAIGLD